MLYPHYISYTKTRTDKKIHNKINDAKKFENLRKVRWNRNFNSNVFLILIDISEMFNTNLSFRFKNLIPDSWMKYHYFLLTTKIFYKLNYTNFLPRYKFEEWENLFKEKSASHHSIQLINVQKIDFRLSPSLTLLSILHFVLSLTLQMKNKKSRVNILRVNQ